MSLFLEMKWIIRSINQRMFGRMIQHFIAIIEKTDQIENVLVVVVLVIGYSPPLTNLAAQTEFSQPQKDCSGSSKDAHGL